MSTIKQTVYVICLRYPTCQCTEVVMGLPSCSVTTKTLNQKSSSPPQKKHRETGTWTLSFQKEKKRVNKGEEKTPD